MTRRYDRTGEPYDDEEQAPADHDQRCRNGWLGEDNAGRLIPCELCRPHLTTLPDGRVVDRRSLSRRLREEP